MNLKNEFQIHYPRCCARQSKLNGRPFRSTCHNASSLPARPSSRPSLPCSTLVCFEIAPHKRTRIHARSSPRLNAELAHAHATPTQEKQAARPSARASALPATPGTMHTPR
eukprot:2346061-Pleurochrysis_carterae.AAC.1